MELENNEMYYAEQVFTKSILTTPNVALWLLYLNYVRRQHNLAVDTTDQARKTVMQTYEFVLEHIGNDRDAGQLWQDYIQFIRSWPGTLGGTDWRDGQKMDALRSAYQRAICIPTSVVNAIWKDYDSFEMGLNKTTVSSELLRLIYAY